MKIFIDLDGVCADFNGSLREISGGDMPDKIPWRHLGHEFFAGLKQCHLAKAGVQHIERLGFEYYFLTGGTSVPGSWSGKMQWLTKFLGCDKEKARNKLIVADAKNKPLLAGPDRLLIDDYLVNCESWVNAGGVAIHHQQDWMDNIHYLEKEANK